MTWVLLLAVGCHDGREVVVYTSVDQPDSEPLFELFETRTGIRVRPVYDVESSKTTGLIQRLDAERDHPRADVLYSSEVVQTLWLADRGVLAPYRSPAASDVAPFLRDPADRWTGVGLRARVLLVNTDRVDAARMPDTVFDLVDERWEPGEVAVANPLFGTTFTHATALYTTLGEPRARAFLLAVRDGGPRVVDGNATVRDLVASGEVAAGLTDNDDAHGAVERGAPVRVIVPAGTEAGALFVPSTVAVVAGGPHPREAEALADWLLSSEAEQIRIESGFYLASVRDPPPGASVDWAEIAARGPAVRESLRELFLR